MDLCACLKGSLIDVLAADFASHLVPGTDGRILLAFRGVLEKQAGVLTSALRPPGNLSKTCTADGWSEMHPLDIAVNCGYNLNGTSDDVSRLQLIGGGWSTCGGSQ